MVAIERCDTIVVGDRLPAEPLDYQLAPSDIKAYLGAIPHQSRRYRNAWSSAPAALVVARFCDACAASRELEGSSIESVSFQAHRQLRSGEALVMTGTVIDLLQAGDRPVVAIEAEAVDSDNRVVLSGRVAFAWEKTP
jgi:hypothetical protein